MEIDRDLLNRQTSAYAGDYSAYCAYAEFLRKALASACRELAPYAFVEARAKDPASFAEKIVRKQAKFLADPNYDVTDRCGARVVVQSSEQARVISTFIEKNFLIDAANSLDHGAHLRTMEFGYRSIHYVVQLFEDDRLLAGVEIPSVLKKGRSGFKAEIQVRTLAEHVLSSGLHDRLYKVSIQVPEPLKRENAGLSAALESVDARYSALVREIDAYLGHYFAYLTKDKIEEEITILQAAREYEKNPAGKVKLTMRLAILARLSGQLDKAVAELEGVANLVAPTPADFRAELGYTLCRRSADNPQHPDFLRGQEILTQVVDEKPPERQPETTGARTLRAKAANRLAWSLSLQSGREADARDRFREARELDSNPYHLVAYLEYEIFCTRGSVTMMADVLRAAIATCERHIAVGIEIPRAHFTIGRLYLLLGDLPLAMAAMVAGIARMLEPGSGIAPALLRDELAFLQRINPASRLPPDHQMVRRLLLVGQAVAERKPGQTGLEISLPASSPEIVERIRQHASRGVLIVAGGAGGMAAVDVQKYQIILERALGQCDGLVLAGGTDCGIPGLVGKVATNIGPKGERPFHLLGYASTWFSKDVHPDTDNYDEIVHTAGEDFSMIEPLQSWVDLLRAGIDPARVQLLCINGGNVAAFEMRLALALGARIGVVAGSGRAAAALLADPFWKNHRNRVVALPADGIDRATMRAFVRPATFTLPASDLDKLAEQVHKSYLEGNIYSDTDFSPQRRKYKDLRPDFKESNRQQVLYAAEILASEGYRIVKHDGKPDDIVLQDFGPEGTERTKRIERMAELEHGRWDIERLSSGWTYGKFKDPERKITNWLVPYEKLPDGEDGMKKYDREAIVNYAKVFKAGGYAIEPSKGIVADKKA